jgi:hypothetical protein
MIKLSRLFIFGGSDMTLKVFVIAFEKLKILYSIIVSYSVFVMNNLIRIEISSETFLHDEAMLKDIPSFGSKGMIGGVYHDVTSISAYPSSPSRSFFSSKIGKEA